MSTRRIHPTSPRLRRIHRRLSIEELEPRIAPGVLTINDVAQVEGNSGTTNIVFTVTLSAATGLPVTVQYASSNRTALAGSDYTSVSGTLTIGAGQTSGTIGVPIIGDTVYEADETFYLNLSNPVNATMADTQGVGTILDDDSPPTVTININDVSQPEGNSGITNMVFTVTLSAATGLPVTVQYATSNGTALAGSDYTSFSGTLTIGAGQTSGTIGVPIIGDVLYEADETFYLNLSNPVGATFGTSQGTGLILNDDPAPAGPDLVGSLGAITAPTILVPGDKFTAKLVVTNQGTSAATGKIAINFWGSADTVLGEDRNLGSLKNLSVKLPPGKSATYTAKLVVPLDAPPGGYYLLGDVDSTNAIAESNETNNLAVRPGKLDVEWEFGNFGGRKNVALNVADTAGTPVKFTLTGAGYGEVVGGPDFDQVIIHGTTAGAAVTIATTGTKGTAIHDFNSDFSLKNLTAKTTSLLGNMKIGGSLGAMTLDDINGDTIEIGSPSGLAPAAGAALTFDEVNSLSLMTSGVPIKSITAKAWMAGTAITAPSVGTINIKNGNFAADVEATTGGIGNISVKGGDLNGSLTAGNGSIGNITVTGLAWFSKEDGQGRFDGGNIGSAEIKAGQSIGNITLTGGGIPIMSITAGTNVGNITIKPVRYLAGKDPEGSWYDTAVGVLACHVGAGGKVGNISITGGGFTGSVYAGQGIGNVTLTSIVGKAGEDYFAADFGGGALESETSIGNITVKGSSIGAMITATNSIGNITISAQTYNATKYYDSESEDYVIEDGGVYGGQVELTIKLGENNPFAKIGTIGGAGAEGIVSGNVPNLLLPKVKISSNRLTYTATYDYNDEDPPKLVAVKATVGGVDDMGESLLVNNLQAWG